MKQGIQIRAQAPPVEIALPLAWRSRAGIHWGDRSVANVVRFPSCPGESWLVFVGGFHLRQPSACLPLDVRVGAQQARIHVGIGRRCPAAGS
jgi:hypothetical protein